MKVALSVILGLVFLSNILLAKTLSGMPIKELRRRARGRTDQKAMAIYKLAAFGRSSELFLWLLGALSAAGLILLAANKAWWLGFLIVLVAAWLMWMSRPLQTSGGWLWRLAALLAPLASALISFLQPVLGRLSSWFRHPARTPTRLYEKEDLLELLKAQGRQADNRISASDLKLAAGALSLADKAVGSVMTPRRKIKWVAASDPIGPMVMDELHKTGHSRFPVVREVTRAASPQIIGALYLKDLLDNLEEKGRIRDIMHPGVHFINESHSLRSALDGFIKSGQYLLVVVNNFEEVAGVLTFEDVIEQILGEKIADEFENYGDPRSVAKQTDSQPPEAELK